jgi:hypothetical protein
MTRRAASWEAFLARRGPHVRDRLRRLNPPDGPPPGSLVRGLHRRSGWERRFLCGDVSLAALVRRHGQAAVDAALERGLQVEKDGRRRWVLRFQQVDFGFVR